MVRWADVWFAFLARHHHEIIACRCSNRGQCQNWPRWDATIWAAWLEVCRN